MRKARMVLNRAYDEMRKEKNELYEMFVENKGVLTRIQSGYPYRIYRKSRNWFNRLLGPRGSAETKDLKKCQQIADDNPWMPINRGGSIVTKHLLKVYMGYYEKRVFGRGSEFADLQKQAFLAF